MPASPCPLLGVVNPHTDVDQLPHVSQLLGKVVRVRLRKGGHVFDTAFLEQPDKADTGPRKLV